jgi:hypothetical protein
MKLWDFCDMGVLYNNVFNKLIIIKEKYYEEKRKWV